LILKKCSLERISSEEIIKAIIEDAKKYMVKIDGLNTPEFEDKVVETIEINRTRKIVKMYNMFGYRVIEMQTSPFPRLLRVDDYIDASWPW